jgi:hypothetical protein
LHKADDLQWLSALLLVAMIAMMMMVMEALNTTVGRKHFTRYAGLNDIVKTRFHVESCVLPGL